MKKVSINAGCYIYALVMLLYLLYKVVAILQSVAVPNTFLDTRYKMKQASLMLPRGSP